MMRLKLVLFAVLAVGVFPASALAEEGKPGKTPERSKTEHRSDGVCAHHAVELRGVVSAVGESGFALDVKQANAHGKAAVGRTVRVVVVERTRFRPEGASPATLKTGDRVGVAARVCKDEAGEKRVVAAKVVVAHREHGEERKREHGEERKREHGDEHKAGERKREHPKPEQKRHDAGAQVAALQAEFERKLAAMRAEFDASLASKRAEFEAKLASAPAGERDRLRAEFEARIAAAKAEFEARVARLKAEFQAKLERLKAEAASRR